MQIVCYLFSDNPLGDYTGLVIWPSETNFSEILIKIQKHLIKWIWKHVVCKVVAIVFILQYVELLCEWEEHASHMFMIIINGMEIK